MGPCVFLRESRGQPVVAILTTDDPERIFRGDRHNYLDLIKAGDAMGILIYVTTVKHLHLNQSKVLGYQCRSRKKGWKKSWFPAPQVIYNRVPFRKHERRAEVHAKLDECMNHPKVQMFNPFFFNKWTLIEWLNKSPATRKYIPDTRKFSSGLNLRALLSKYPFLYLKPERGKAGKGIMRIKRSRSSSIPYQLSVQDRRKSIIFKYKTIQDLQEKLDEYIGEKAYIAQQGIKLAMNEKRPFDLRLLAQKDRQGIWQVTGIGARVAGELSITTHVPRGGSIEKPSKLLGGVFGRRSASSILKKSRRAALLIAKQIEKECGHSLGEMSMDLGVDHEGNIWFFEANSKPMKFDEPDIRQKSLKRLMEYFHYLSEKGKIQAAGGAFYANE